MLSSCSSSSILYGRVVSRHTLTETHKRYDGGDYINLVSLKYDTHYTGHDSLVCTVAVAAVDAAITLCTFRWEKAKCDGESSELWEWDKSDMRCICCCIKYAWHIGHDSKRERERQKESECLPEFPWRRHDAVDLWCDGVQRTSRAHMHIQQKNTLKTHFLFNKLLSYVMCIRTLCWRWRRRREAMSTNDETTARRWRWWSEIHKRRRNSWWEGWISQLVMFKITLCRKSTGTSTYIYITKTCLWVDC